MKSTHISRGLSLVVDKTSRTPSEFVQFQAISFATDQPLLRFIEISRKFFFSFSSKDRERERETE